MEETINEILKEIISLKFLTIYNAIMLFVIFMYLISYKR